MKKITVIAGFYREDGRALVLRRSPDKKQAKGYPNLWEFPGGKEEPQETPLDALTREWQQELGVQVLAVGDKIGTTVVERPTMVVTIHLYEVRQIEGTPRPVEDMHSAMNWFSTDKITELSVEEAPGICGLCEDVLSFV